MVQVDYKGMVEYARMSGKSVAQLSSEEKARFIVNGEKVLDEFFEENRKVRKDLGLEMLTSEQEEELKQSYGEAYLEVFVENYILRRWKAMFEVYREFRFKYGMSVEHMLKLLAKDEGVTEEEVRVLYEEYKKQWDKEPKTFAERMAQECGVPLVELSGQSLDKKVYLMARGMEDSCYIVLEMEYGKVALYLFNYLRMKTINRGVELRIEESLDLNDVPYEIVSEETFIATVEEIW